MKTLASYRPVRLVTMLLLLLALIVALAACGGAPAPAPVATIVSVSQVGNTPAPVVAVPPSGNTGPAAAATALPGKPAAAKTAIPVKNSAANADCAAADQAYQGFAFGSQLIISLRSDDAYSGLVNNSDNNGMFNLDTAALRADLAVLAKLPDAVGEAGDKTSTIIATTRQVLDLIDSNAKSGKPFTDGSGNGQKVLDIWMPLAVTQRANLALVAAFSAACRSYTPAPRATPTPLTFQLKTKAECSVLDATLEHFGVQSLFLTALTDDDAYAILQPDAANHVDTAALRADLKVLATLPDIAEITTQYHGKPSQMVPAFQQVLAQIDANVRAGSQPFGDGSGNGQKVIDLMQAAMGEGRVQVFPATVALVCP